VAYAIQCYVCSTIVGSGCGDPFDGSGSGVTHIIELLGTDCQACTKAKTGSGEERI